MMFTTVQWVLFFLLGFGASLVLVAWVRNLAIRLGVVVPVLAGEKHLHKTPTPKLGGLGVYLAFFLVLVVASQTVDGFVGGVLPLQRLIGIAVAGAVLMLGGYLDDKYDLPGKYQIMFPVVAALIAVASGVGIAGFSNPFGGAPIDLSWWRLTVFATGSGAHTILVFADLFAFVWLMVMMYTTKLLDGVDGVSSGVTGIAALVIFLASVGPSVAQTEVGLLALIFSGVCFGFLVFHTHPAKIFAGEGGSVFFGFMIGVLSILATSKVAIALLVLGVPLLDLVWVLARRAFWEKKNPFTHGDRKHLHHRLLDSGLSQRATALFFYATTAIFGFVGVFLQSMGKLVALVVLCVCMLFFAVWLLWFQKRKKA